MTWDWTQVTRIIGEHCTHRANEPVITNLQFTISKTLDSTALHHHN